MQKINYAIPSPLEDKPKPPKAMLDGVGGGLMDIMEAGMEGQETKVKH
jgi:hypothetical protein